MKNSNMVRHNTTFRREILFERLDVLERFVDLYSDLFENNGPNTNRMYKGCYNNSIRDEKRGITYYNLIMICDNETWDYINKYNVLKRKEITDEYGYTRTKLVYQV